MTGATGLEAAVITTYRCNARCHMCDVWKHPTDEAGEISPDVLDKLPALDFCNITGGEPFLRRDISDIVGVLKEKAKRVVISTNGYFTARVLEVAHRHRDVGFRISIEGLPAANDELRGLRDGFDHGLRTLLELQRMGVKDIGFGITVSDRNARDMIELYRLANSMGVEFATAAVHNSYYFHKYDNEITKKAEVASCFEELVSELLHTGRVKNWFRAYFNHGLINYINGGKRLLPCEAGSANFFVDPWGEVKPCNGMDDGSVSMGNLNEKSFSEIWDGVDAARVRDKVKNCPKNCWMIGSVAPVIKKHLLRAGLWILSRKWKRQIHPA